MAHLKLSLLGAFEASLDGKSLSGIKTDKARALLIYLTVECNRAHRRQALAGLLWPDYPEEGARANLRHALANLRHVLGEEQNETPFLLVEGETIQFNPESDYRVDVDEFKRFTSSLCDLETAIRLYRGSFLEGFTVKDSPDFDNWTAILRERYQVLASAVLGKLSDHAEQSQDYEKAINYARRRLELEPWQEDAHRQLMHLLAFSGQRAAALAQYETCCKILKEELGVEPSVETRRLQASIRAGEIEGSKQEKTRRHNLPAQVTSFIGREKEMEQVKGLLQPHRLVTLTGSGGMGKTRLSVQVGREMLEKYPDGVWMVELASLADSELVVQTVARTLGMSLGAGVQALLSLEDFLESKHLLLILDNCEHLIEACARLADALLKACPYLHILASSREALGIDGEASYRVPPLSLPDPQNLPPFEALEQYEAVSLFVDRSATASPEFQLTQENAPAVAQICQRLEGIPLALELAAARAKVLRMEEIALRLDDRFRLLTGGSRATLPRYQTLRTSIDWSYDLLSQPEQSLLQCLSIFAGSWVLEAAEFVGCGEDFQHCDVLDGLAQLVNKSLVIVDEESQPETHYRMLETIRQYAHEKLVESGKAEAAHDRHLTYYVELAERFEGKTRGPDMLDIMRRLEVELDNLRSAFEWCLTPPVSVLEIERSSWLIEQGLRLGGALHWLWHCHGRNEEGGNILSRLLTKEACLKRLPGVLDIPFESKRMMVRAKALLVACECLMADNLNLAWEFVSESRDLYAKLGEQGKVGYACALMDLGNVESRKRNYSLGEKYSQESRAIFHEMGEKFLETEAINMLGWFSGNRQAFDLALMYFRESLALKKEIGDADGIAYTLYHLGCMVCQDLSVSDPLLNEQARQLWEESRDLFRSIDSISIWMPLIALGELFWTQGDYIGAEKSYREILSIGRRSGDLRRVIDMLSQLGRLALSQGDPIKADELFGEELALSEKRGNQRGIAISKLDFGFLAWEMGGLEQAALNFSKAIKTIRESGLAITFEGEALLGLGRVCLARGDYAEAQTYIQEALQKRFDVGLRWYIYYIEPFAYLTTRQQEIASITELGRATRLLGATQSFHTRWQFTRTPRERQERDNAIVFLRLALGEEAFAENFEEGKAMTQEQAIDYAK
jgi:predicted ATPase/DNA-binding SARP family transcriptional activator